MTRKSWGESQQLKFSPGKLRPTEFDVILITTSNSSYGMRRFACLTTICGGIRSRPSRQFRLDTKAPFIREQCRFAAGLPSANPALGRGFSSSNAAYEDEQIARPNAKPPTETSQRRKPRRPPTGAASLRQVAVEAQRSKDGLQPSPTAALQSHSQAKVDSLRKTFTVASNVLMQRVRAYCVADQFHLPTVVDILKTRGYKIDPYNTALYPQVVHIEQSASTVLLRGRNPSSTHGPGDIFIFPSGTVVVWDVPESIASELVAHILVPATRHPHLDRIETEDLEYIEDVHKENSIVKGDTIILGTKGQTSSSGGDQQAFFSGSLDEKGQHSLDDTSRKHPSTVNIILAKIAFSSGLARSTKLAVLETLLSDYFESTRLIPMMLSKGSRLPFTRSFILRKTGQLLSVRAQLNLYSELTDSLPDIFWDSRHELGLEGYYDQVGRALDVGVRIKLLNSKMDYAQEIASVLRERLSEKHGLTLEWMIIALITIEVAFEVIGLVRERGETRMAKKHSN